MVAFVVNGEGIPEFWLLLFPAGLVIHMVNELAMLVEFEVWLGPRASEQILDFCCIHRIDLEELDVAVHSRVKIEFNLLCYVTIMEHGADHHILCLLHGLLEVFELLELDNVVGGVAACNALLVVPCQSLLNLGKLRSQFCLKAHVIDL